MKMHGGLYNMVCGDETLATAIVEAMARYDEKLIWF